MLGNIAPLSTYSTQYLSQWTINPSATVAEKDAPKFSIDLGIPRALE